MTAANEARIRYLGALLERKRGLMPGFHGLDLDSEDEWEGQECEGGEKVYSDAKGYNSRYSQRTRIHDTSEVKRPISCAWWIYADAMDSIQEYSTVVRYSKAEI